MVCPTMPSFLCYSEVLNDKIWKEPKTTKYYRKYSLFITYFLKWHRRPHVVKDYTSVGRTASKKLRLEKNNHISLTEPL